MVKTNIYRFSITQTARDYRQNRWLPLRIRYLVRNASSGVVAAGRKMMADSIEGKSIILGTWRRIKVTAQSYRL